MDRRKVDASSIEVPRQIMAAAIFLTPIRQLQIRDNKDRIIRKARVRPHISKNYAYKSSGSKQAFRSPRAYSLAANI